MKLTAYPHNDKDMYLSRVRAHREADELIRGTGWNSDDHRGCAVGCTIHCYDHSRYLEMLGVPEQLARIQDFIFENLPEGHLLWPERFLDAIQPGADLSEVYGKWVVRLLDRRLAQLPPGELSWQVQVRDAVTGVRDLFAKTPCPGARAAADAARVAAEVAAAEAAADAAAYAAAAATRAYAAAYTARAATRAAYTAMAFGKEVQQQADDLIELIQERTGLDFVWKSLHSV